MEVIGWSSSKIALLLKAALIQVSDYRLLGASGFDLLEPWDVRELYIRKTADLPLQLWVGTFPRFVAIRFYFQNIDISLPFTAYIRQNNPKFTLSWAPFLELYHVINRDIFWYRLFRSPSCRCQIILLFVFCMETEKSLGMCFNDSQLWFLFKLKYM